jgi:hypothetical protein
MSASKELFMQLREEEAGLQHGVSFEHLLDAKKSNIATAVETISQAVKDGNYDSLKGLILAVKGKALFTDLEKSLRPLAEKDYLDKLEKNYTAHDTKIDQAATKTEYDYTVCKDPVYNSLAAQLEIAKNSLKEREAFLKGIKQPLTVVDENTGEVSTIYPPNKLQSDGLKITIK